jgi:hypothetical protein
MFRTFFAFILLAALSVGARAAAQPLGAFEAQYDVFRNGSKLGVSSLKLESTPRGWVYSSRTEGTDGLAALAGVTITEVSRFRWAGDRLELLESTYDQKAAWKKRHRRIVCDEANGRISSEEEKRSTEHAYEPNVIDRHLSVLALANDLAANRPDLAYRVAHKDKLLTDRYAIIGDESIDVPAGRYDALKLELQRDSRDRTTTIWASKAISFLPVKLQQVEPDGETIEMRLRSVTR